ncbi:MAG: NUDIX hydrolase [Candidatus Nanopelagicales bacterium]
MPIPEFVTRLREAVGTELLWLSGVSAVVFDDQDRLLLGERADLRHWAVVSGILEPGEEPAIAAVREVLEETGIQCEVVALTAVSVTPVVRYGNGDSAQYLDLCFWCRSTGGTATVGDDESLAVGWFARNALPQPMSATSALRIEKTLQFILELQGGGRPGPWLAGAVGA